MSRAIFVLRSYERDDFAVVEALARDHGVAPTYVVANVCHQRRAEALGALFQNSASLRAGYLHQAFLPLPAPESRDEERRFGALAPSFRAGVDAVLDRVAELSRGLGLTPRQHLLSSIVYWQRVLVRQAPAFAFFAETPHQIHDLALQIACDASGVPVRILRGTSIPGMQFVSERIPCGLDGGLGHGLDEFSGADVRAELRRLKSDYEQARPEFMDRHMANDRSPEIQALQDALAWLRDRCVARTGGEASSDAPQHGDGFARGLGTPGRPRRVFSRAVGRTWTLMAQRSLRNAYAAVARRWQPRAGEPYVYFPLHFQPEMSTAPEGGHWAEQAHVIEAVVKHLPKGWRLVVKEHPLQLHAGLQGALGRVPSWYRAVAALDPRITFVERTADPFALIDGANGVITVTGTAGWEGLSRGKPVLCSEGAWYTNFPRTACLSEPGDMERFFAVAGGEGVGGFEEDVAEHLDGLRDRLFHCLSAVGNHMTAAGAERLATLLASWCSSPGADGASGERSTDALLADVSR